MTTNVDGGLTDRDFAGQSWDSGPGGKMMGELANHAEDIFRWFIGREDTKAKCAHMFCYCRGNEAEEVVTKDSDVRFMGGKTREEVWVH